MYKKLLCNNIRKLREKVNLTQDEFSEKIGISTEALRNIEHLKSSPRTTTIDNICKAFHILPLVLLLDNENKEDLNNLIIQKLKICDKNDKKLINGFIDVLLTNKE